MSNDAHTAGAASPATALADAAAGLDACVHCGFCLQACPTYLALSDENDSPRGRLFLMRAVVEGDLAATDPAFRTHIDRCLGCRACETACPSGVPYGALLEASRATIGASRPVPRLTRMLLATMARPVWRSAALALGRALRATGLARLFARLPGRVGFACAMLESSRPVAMRANYAPHESDARGRVAVLVGCVMEGLFAPTNEATRRTLAMNEYRLVPAPGQGCCGALHAHAGDLAGARALARRNIVAFEQCGADSIAVNAAGCGAMMKEYGHLFGRDASWRDRAAAIGARVRDVTELLAAAGPRPGGPLPLSVAYDAPCHLLHAQRVGTAPLTVLRAIPDLDLTPLPDADQCCGGAGIYNLVEPGLSRAVLAPKLSAIGRSAAQFVATGNPGCHMQIGAGLLQTHQPARCIHPVDLLDASYARLRPS